MIEDLERQGYIPDVNIPPKNHAFMRPFDIRCGAGKAQDRKNNYGSIPFSKFFFALFQMRQWWQEDRTIGPRLLVWFFFLDKFMKIKIQRDRFLRSAYRLSKSNPGVKGQRIRFRVHGDEPTSGMGGQRKHYLKDLENHPGPDTFPDIL
jgi:hypothetical protein